MGIQKLFDVHQITICNRLAILDFISGVCLLLSVVSNNRGSCIRIVLVESVSCRRMQRCWLLVVMAIVLHSELLLFYAHELACSAESPSMMFISPRSEIKWTRCIQNVSDERLANSSLFCESLDPLEQQLWNRQISKMSLLKLVLMLIVKCRYQRKVENNSNRIVWTPNPLLLDRMK